MADTKITGLLTPQVTTNPATDVLPIVNIADTSMASSGSTRKITVNQILGSGGTATLASATISGDLTVDTSTLKVDSANNRVGIVQASPLYPLHLVGEFGLQEETPAGSGTKLRLIGDATKYNFRLGKQLTATNTFEITPSTTVGGTTFSNPVYTVTYDGIHTFLDGAGGTRMTLNSTGLGVQATPSAPFTVKTRNSDSVGLRVLQSTGGTGGIQFTDDPVTADWGAIQATSANVIFRSNTILKFQTGGVNDRVTIDSSGNVGVGVTPSAWGSFFKSIESGAPSAYVIAAANVNGVQLSSNCYNDNTNWLYKTTGTAARFAVNTNQFQWFNAPSGTAGTAITFTQAMTLTASGDLLVGTTSAAGVRLDVQTTTGNCIGRVKSNAAASTASFIIDYVETLGCTYIKKAGSDVWIYGVQNDTSATPNFKINTASNVGVQLVSGATAWTTLSDETVKDIIEPIGNAVAKVGSLRSVIGKFKTDSEGTRRSFLIAQDVKSVLPEAVDVVGENNELGLRYTEVIPLLVAAIKELSAEVNALKNA